MIGSCFLGLIAAGTIYINPCSIQSLEPTTYPFSKNGGKSVEKCKVSFNDGDGRSGQYQIYLNVSCKEINDAIEERRKENG